MNKGLIDIRPGVVATVPSKSEGHVGKRHEIRLSKNGVIYCDCEGYRWRGHCSHIQMMMDSVPGSKMFVKAGLREKIANLEKIIAALDE